MPYPFLFVVRESSHQWHHQQIREASLATASIRRYITTESQKYFKKHPSPRLLPRFARRTGYVVLGLGTIWAFDKVYNASSISRNFMTLWTCAAITSDYKWNFTPDKSDLIPELHERVAERMYNLFTTNGGLYIKIGQAIGVNSAFLPKPMQVKFASLFDDAPQIPYSVVEKVFMGEFGRPPSGTGGVFQEFEEKAVASASIAQVHRAKTWPVGGQEKGEGRWVAVKIQKPDVRKQMEWDLAAYKAVMWMFEHWAFDLPVYFVVDFISDHLRRELDFVEEAENARKTAEFIKNEPRLVDRVYIPKVYSEYSTKRVMTAEWIDGVRLSDPAGIRGLMGERDETGDDIRSTGNKLNTCASPPLKGGVKAIMQIMVELFSAQMFSWGWVHCDPHPGNILVRPHPSRPSVPQLVLIDHGLYVGVEERFRTQWVELWKGLLAGNQSEVERVTREWGMGVPEIMASAAMMRPVKFGKRRMNEERRNGGQRVLSQYEMSVKMKEKLRSFLTDTDRMPKALIFLLRNMRIVQGNNQSLGSPVNRIKITGFWASRSLSRSPNLTLPQRIREYWHHLVFRGIMFSLDLVFWKNRLSQWMRRTLGMQPGEGFESELERLARSFATTSLGVELGAGAFHG